MSFEEAKQYLRREDDDGDSLYEHLSRVLLKVIVEKPSNANSVFEQLSQELRGSTRVTPTNDAVKMLPCQEQNAQLEWCEFSAGLYSKESDAAEISYPDIMTEANVYEWNGVDFGRMEIYQLYLSIKQKAMIEAQNLRFWGKIFGTSGDYYVVQGTNPEPPSAMEVLAMEGAEGTNKYAFWVCNCVGGAWIRLPNVTPDAIVIARKIKRFFTGNINAPVPSYPPFPGGTEAYLLRAQIALITSECSISPSGFYVEDDDTDEGIKGIKKVEEMDEYKSVDDLKDLGSWVHHEVPINVNGRCNQPTAGEEDEDSAEPAEELTDLPLLGAISEDEIADGPGWAVTVYPGGAGESPDSTVCIKSQKWPGAYAAAFGNKFVNVYCGFGCSSARGARYEPSVAPSVQKEWMPAEEDGKGMLEEEDKITQPVVDEGEEDED